VIISVGLAVIDLMGLWGHPPAWVGNVYRISAFGLPVAVLLAVTGLFKDSRPHYAALALLLSVALAFIYSMMMPV